MARPFQVSRFLLEALGETRTRVLAGVALVLHGLAHAVLPLRGAGRLAHSTTARVVVDLTWGTAMVGFAVAGFGLLGVSPFTRFRRTAAALGVAASFAALAAMRQVDLLPGALIDVFVLVAFFRAGFDDAKSTPARVVSRWRRAARVVGNVTALFTVAYLAVCATTRSFHHRWGMTDEELLAPLPGDTEGRDPGFEVNHGVTIDAPPSAVWPWLVQIGQDRAGFYSYDWLENVFGLDIHNADRVHPEWQERREGDLVRAAPADWLWGAFGENVGWRISLIEPNRVLALRWWGAFVLEPIGNRTRLLVRSKVSDPKIPVWAAALSFMTFELPHFIMERRMLTTIKTRVERVGHESPDATSNEVIASP